MDRKTELYKKQYPQGTRIELISMDDVQAPPEGTRGTVIMVDAMGDLIVDWDNGSGLNLVIGVDRFKVVEGKK